MNLIINYQAFLDNKKIISLNSLETKIKEYHLEHNIINGILSTFYTGNLSETNEIKKFNEEFSFTLDLPTTDIEEIEINDLMYQIVDGRGIELEVNFLIVYETKDESYEETHEEAIRLSDNNIDDIKKEIEAEVEEILENVMETYDDNFPEENNEKNRITFIYTDNIVDKNSYGKRYIKRN